MNPIESWQYETLGKAACEALKKNRFDARYAASSAEALEIVASFIKPGMKVGVGGSMTLRAIGAVDRVKEAGAELLDHNAPGLDKERKFEVMRAQVASDLFLAGANAVTLDGELVNKDANGNRVGALCFGPRKTVVVVGANKIVRDLDEALLRVETKAAPLNNRRLERPNPCVKTGYCMDCQGETRICNIIQVLQRRPPMTDFTVVVVGEALGF